MKYIRNLPKAVKKAWVRQQVDVLREEQEKQVEENEANADEEEEEETQLTAQTLDNLICFALQMSPDCELPRGFVGHGYEGPMAAVMTARAKQCGDLLQKLTKDMIRQGTYGYFQWRRDEPEKVEALGKRTHSRFRST